ncbi:hypothetical protein RhiirC2_787281 [Rhizophagus irregularis]|uniref:Uncharacterized protein n=1 Tax=Rhizophagus irregularis TaxID=588596 RepID=A0A2N1MSK7_9GLOM|nr:hypothetical protein RhiirC2_787281 [Rhizophagus irregularis]
MSIYMEIQINSDLQANEKIHILVTYDETTFHSNDGRNSGWAPDNEQPLRKKGQGRAIHISRLQLSEEQKLSEIGNKIPHKARIMMNPGKNNDATHPNAIGIFAFDNSTSHGAFAPDALVASRMNVNPGGKQPKMRNTIFNGQVQSMNFPDNYWDPALQGKPKGMKQVIEECQLMGPGLIGYCRTNESKDIQCCMRHIFKNQPDFLAQKGMIQEGASKKYSRKNCDYSWTDLQQVVPIALNQVPLSQIRAFARKSYRYIDAYQKGLDVKQAEYAVKRYKRHRNLDIETTSNNFIENIIDEPQIILKSLLSNIEISNIIEIWKIRHISGFSCKYNIVILLDDETHLSKFHISIIFVRCLHCIQKFDYNKVICQNTNQRNRFEIVFFIAKTAVNIALETNSDCELIQLLKDFIEAKREQNVNNNDNVNHNIVEINKSNQENNNIEKI